MPIGSFVQTINNDAILLTVPHESVRLLWVNYYYYLNNINNKSRGKLTWGKQRRSRWLLGNDILLARCLGFWHSFSGSPRLLCIISWTNWERRSKLTHCQKLNQSDPILLSFHRIWWNILNLSLQPDWFYLITRAYVISPNKRIKGNPDKITVPKERDKKQFIVRELNK